MTAYPTQLLESTFQPSVPSSLWNGLAPSLRFVVKLHEATRLHFYFRIELYDRLLSFSIDDIGNCWSGGARAIRVGDHDPKYLLSERCIPAGQSGAGPMLVWDYGTYSTNEGTAEDVYRQLLAGSLTLELKGIRLKGSFLVSGGGKDWQIKRISGDPPEPTNLSALTGRSLQEIREGLAQGPSIHWLEWRHFYSDQIPDPQVAVKESKVVDMNAAAEECGIFTGMRLHHVLPLVPNCKVKDWAPDPLKQDAWLKHLLDYSDTIQPFDSHSAALDLSPHPNPHDISTILVANLSSMPFGRLSHGAGPSIWIARLAANQNAPYRYIHNAARELSGQPVNNLLSLPHEERDRLQNLGFETIGEIASVSIEILRTQFGERAHLIHLAAQGKTRDHLIPLYPSNGLTKSFSFNEPINDSLILQHAVSKLTEHFASKIAGRQAGQVMLTMHSENGSQKTLSRPFNRPVHTIQRLRASLSYLAEEIQKDCPDIVRITARLDKLEPLKSSQQDLYFAINRVGTEATLASLKGSLGERSVLLASQIETPRRDQVMKAWRNATGWH